MARVAAEPTPSPGRVLLRSLRHLALRDALAALMAAWRLAFEPSAPVSPGTRASAAGVFLSVVLFVGVGSAIVSAGALAMLSPDGREHLPVPAASPSPSVIAEASASPSPEPTASPSPSPSLEPSPSPSATPTTKPEATPSAKAKDERKRATPKPTKKPQRSDDDEPDERDERDEPDERDERDEPEDD